MAVVTSGVPDVTIKQVLLDGVDALSANPGLLAPIWRNLAPADIAQLTAFWAQHPPVVLTGYARRTDSFPAWAITLASDGTDTTLIDDGEMWDDDEEDTIQREITQLAFRVYVYAESPDVCAAYYRVLRRVLQVGKRRMESEGLLNITLSGSELAPDPSYTPDNMYVRQLTLSCIVEDTWSATDALAVALGPLREARLTATGELLIRHVDAGGGVTPVDF